MHIQDLIHQNIDALLTAQSNKENLTIAHIIEIGAYVAAGALRGRFAAEKEVSQEEINGVFGVIGDFYKDHFDEAFTEDDFKEMTDQALQLLQRTTFDADLESYVQAILN